MEANIYNKKSNMIDMVNYNSVLNILNTPVSWVSDLNEHEDWIWKMQRVSLNYFMQN